MARQGGGVSPALLVKLGSSATGCAWWVLMNVTIANRPEDISPVCLTNESGQSILGGNGLWQARPRC